MLKTEQQISAPTELPPKEDIERVAYCVGTYLSAFSKEPFDEKWSVDGVKSPAFLLNPKTTGEFVKEVLNDENTEIFSLEDGSEKAKVQKKIVLDHIEKTLDDPMTEYLFSTDWISEDEVVNLTEIKNMLEKKEEDFVEIDIPYPLTSIFESYIDATQEPLSMVLLGYQSSSSWSPENEVKFLRIQEFTPAIENVYPRFIARYLTANSPKLEEKVNVHDLVLKEVGYYLDDEQKEELKKSIDPDEYTSFFGELAKIPSADRTLKAMLLSGVHYANILTDMSFSKNPYESLDLIQRQMIYLSITGTTVVSEKDDKGTKFLDTARALCQALGIEHKEKMLKFLNNKNQEILIGIVQRIT